MNSYKIVVVGDGAVGKTCLLMSYTQKMFPREYIPTVFDNFSKNVDYKGTHVRLDLYDTAGQEDYDRLRVICYPNTDVFLVCYSIDSEMSMKNIQSKWLPELRHHAPKASILVVGLKNDLRKDSNKIAELKSKGLTLVTEKEGDDFATENDCKAHILCSALEMKNIDNVFMKAITVASDKANDKEKPCCTIV